MARALIALGANLGDRTATLNQAVERLADEADANVLAVSSWRETAPSGGPADQPAYRNGAVLIESALAPAELLAALHRLEKAAGRVRDERWGPRTLDLDLLLFDEQVIEPQTRGHGALILPHPRMALRRFVLEPAAEIAADMRDPITGWSIAKLLAHLNSSPPLIALAGLPRVGKTATAAMISSRLGGDTLLGPSVSVFASSTIERHLNLLESRATLVRLASETGERWRVADFWLPQSLAYAGVALPLHDQAAIAAALARHDELLPRFTVVLETPVDQVWRSVRTVNPALSSLDEARFRQLDRALVALTHQQNRGPILRLKAPDIPGAQEDLVAEIVATAHAGD